ncbi:MAG: GAF domain-containing protein [Aggregatilineaceae bacterium]
MILLVLLGEVVLAYGLAHGILLDSFADLEAEEARRNTARVINALNNNLQALAATTADWAEWDDTDLFIQGELPSYRETALDDSTFTRLNLHLIALINAAGEVIYAKTMPPGATSGGELSPTQAERTFSPHTSAAELSQLAVGEPRQGLTVLPDGALLLAAYPITPSTGEGLAHGVLVMGRFVDAEQIGALASLGTIRLQIRHFAEPGLPPDFLRAYEHLVGTASTYIEPIGEDVYAGYALLNDLQGQPVFVLRVEMPRPISAHGRDTVSYLLAAFLAGGLALAALNAIIVGRLIVARVLRLTRLVQKVAQTQDTSLRAPVDGRDELATLAAGLNAMLRSVEAAHQAQADSQEQLQQVIASISDLLYAIEYDAQGQPVWYQVLSPQITALTGYPLDQFNQDRGFWPSLIHPDDRPRLAAFAAERADGQAELEYRLRRADGTYIWVRDREHCRLDPTTGHMHIYGVVSDITARRAAEQAEREQRTFAEALVNTIALVNQTLEPDVVLDRILESIRQVLPHDSASIMLIEGDHTRIVRHSGFAERGLADFVSALRYPVNNLAKFRQMKEIGRPVCIPDTLGSPDWVQHEELTWIRSYIGAPIMVEGEMVGVLNLDSATPNFFTQAHAERLQAFADQVAIALRNARLFSAECEQRAFAEALADTAAAINSSLELDTVLDRVLANIGRVATYDMANILLVDGGVARVVGTSPPLQDAEQIAWTNRLRMPLSDFANLRQIVETSQPQVIADTVHYPGWVKIAPHDWIRSVASAPIISANEVIGFVILNSATPNFFTQAHAERLQAFADQVAIALRNARLFATVQQHAAELEQRVQERTEELEQRRAQLQAILDSIGEGVIYDEKLRTRYVNRALTTLTGYEAGEFAGYLELLRSSAYTRDEFDAIVQDIYEAVDTRGTWEGEMCLRRKDGHEFDAALIVSRVCNTAGESIGAVTVVHDISQQKALQQQKDRFIANASHELRTPLTNIRTRLYLLRHQPEQAHKHLEVLDRVVTNMSELIESLLDVSRFERGVIALNRQPVVLQDLLSEVISIQQAEAERKRIALSVSLPSAPLTAHIDPHRMAQVLTNLITNAINYTPEGGRIGVELTRADSAGHQRAIIRVRDSGAGIPSNMIDQVFEPFFRAHEGAVAGTGLGLTIAREIVRLHGGEIWAESTAGQGSVFSVALDVFPSSESVVEEA